MSLPSILLPLLRVIFSPKIRHADPFLSDPPPRAPWALVTGLMAVPDRAIIRKCGLDAYFFLRYLKTLLVIFVPLACVVLPILIPINFVDGIGTDLWSNSTSSNDTNAVVGLSVLAWGNVKTEHHERRWAHLILAVFVIFWVCFVVFSEMKVYVKVTNHPSPRLHFTPR